MLKKIRVMFRLVRGWVRLYGFGACPNCNSDQQNPCVICRKYHYVGDFTVFPIAQREVWQDFRKLVESR